MAINDSYVFMHSNYCVQYQKKKMIVDVSILGQLAIFWKANVVADALSRKTESMWSLDFISVGERLLSLDVQALANKFMRLDVSEPSQVLACVVSRSYLFERIKAHQYDDPHLLFLKDTVNHDDSKEIIIGNDEVLRLQGRVCAPNVDGLGEQILNEAHSSRYFIYLGAMKMCHDLKHHYWLRRMKKDIGEYVAWYLNCQQVKYEH
ncbi:uncharacterized protein [Nicotiana sylvestris]|uniref:uncharacterized protein n=1 Tax=Nicotiana sylvestris TaxID=4096 RepID=UPI00388C9F6F